VLSIIHLYNFLNQIHILSFQLQILGPLGFPGEAGEKGTPGRPGYFGQKGDAGIPG